METLFDNVVVLFRGRCCLISLVSRPFRTAYWPDIGVIAPDLRLPTLAETTLGERRIHNELLASLTARKILPEEFRPTGIGFRSRAENILARDQYRQRRLLITFLGACSARNVLAGLEIGAQRLQVGGSIDVQFKQWELLGDWSLRREIICEVCNYLYLARGYGGNVMLHSDLREVPADLWQFLYDRPRVRIAWHARDLLGCTDQERFKDYCRGSPPFKHLVEISNNGLWPHVVLPVSGINVKSLPELVMALIEATRGASIELHPSHFVARDAEEPAPQVEDYVKALLAIYRNQRIPLRLVSPLSWVAERIDSQTPLIGSPAAAGAELAILPDGDVYAGECSLGLEHRRLGNVSWGARNIHWERLDAMAEESSYSLRPEPCRSCDWRYRCGGADVSSSPLAVRPKAIPLAEVQDPQSGAHSTQDSDLFDFYCAPRKRLFEELLWGSVEAATRGQNVTCRERLVLGKTGIIYEDARS